MYRGYIFSIGGDNRDYVHHVIRLIIKLLCFTKIIFTIPLLYNIIGIA